MLRRPLRSLSVIRGGTLASISLTNPEGMWAIDGFLRTATEEKRREFLDAVRSGAIHLDGFYVHMMTGLGTEEQLLQLMQPAKDFEREVFFEGCMPIEELARRLIELGADGGYILAPAHDVEGDVPLENMLAMIDVVQAQPASSTSGRRASTTLNMIVSTL